MQSKQPSTTLRRFFAGLAENTFQTQFGVADPPLIDYISDMLLRFVRFDALYKIRSLSGRRIGEIAEMLAEAEARVGDARREVHRHIGDFTLFWTGVFPEALQHRRGVMQMDFFVDYCTQGKRAYHIASTIESSRSHYAPCEVLERLSREFEMCAYGLREVRRQWETREGDDDLPRPFLIN
jgi:hypothetical protein